MQVIQARTVDHGLVQGMQLLHTLGRKRGSRNGEVVVADVPVTTEYLQPRQRVSLLPQRDANPFFHLYEALWMLGGRNDVAGVARYVSRMKTFSDDGLRFHGAYGARWRWVFGFDQLDRIAERLRLNPDCRRQVLQIWNAQLDLGTDTKDAPCNLVVHFQRNWEGHLDMTVFCRSNDIIWGAYGANAVHFSMLQEYMAALIGCQMGRYWQVSDNFHAYAEVYEALQHALAAVSFVHQNDPTTQYPTKIIPLMTTSHSTWARDLGAYLREESRKHAWSEPFFRDVAVPMQEAYFSHKSLRPDEAMAFIRLMPECDWKQAASAWLQRRRKS